MTKQIQLFMTIEDERAISDAIRALVPQAAFVDGALWPTADPPLRNTIADCRESQGFVWNRAIYPTLPSAPRNGAFDGPRAGPVIEFTRSRVISADAAERRYFDSAMVSGRIAWGGSNEYPGFELMRDFVSQVWKAIRRMSPTKLAVVSPDRKIIDTSVRAYVAGPGAVSWWQASPHRVLRDRANTTLYLAPLSKT